MGILNFALTLVVFVTYVALFVTRVAVAVIWSGLMRLLDSLFGSAPGRPSPMPRLPTLPWMLGCVLGEFAACVVTVCVVA